MAYPRSAAVNRISSRARTRGNVIGAADGLYGGLELRGHCRWPAASTSALGRSLRRTLSSEFAAAAVNTTALPTDKTYANQEKAAKILQRVFAEQPNHPGAAHYLIHSYDSAPLADLGLPAASRAAGSNLLLGHRPCSTACAAHALAYLYAGRPVAELHRL
jgi:hypothetical protein